METATDTTQTEISAEVETQSQETNTTEVQTEAFDPTKIDPKIQEHFAKKYEGYDRIKQEADQWGQVRNDPRYQEWVRSLNAPPKPPEFLISDEEHTAALADPRKFQELVLKAADFVNKTRLEPQIQTMEQRAALQESISSLKAFKADHPEFDELDKAGHIEPVLRQYPRISWDDALAIAKVKSGWLDKQADKKARGQVETQRKQISERPGGNNSSKGKKTFSSREQAMEYAYKEAQEGREVDPDDIEIS